MVETRVVAQALALRVDYAVDKRLNRKPSFLTCISSTVHDRYYRSSLTLDIQHKALQTSYVMLVNRSDMPRAVANAAGATRPLYLQLGVHQGHPSLSFAVVGQQLHG